MLNFEANDVVLHGGKPSFVLLTGKDEKQVKFDLPDKADKTSSSCSTPLGTVCEENYVWTDPCGYRFTWSVGRFQNRSGLLLRANFYNGSAEPVRLREIVLCQTPANAVKVEGDPNGWLLSSMTYSRRTGTMGECLPSVNDITRLQCEGLGQELLESWVPAEEKKEDGHWREYFHYLMLYSDKGKKGWTFGAVGKLAADLRYDCRVDDGKMTLIATSLMSDVVVEPGQSRDAQDMVILAEPYTTAVASMVSWIGDTQGRRAHRKPIFGWCSWYHQHRDISAESVGGLADAVKKLKDQIPFQTIQIDSGYERTAGDWRGNEKFPEGLKPVVEKIQSAGAMPGIWFAGLAVHNSLDVFKEHPDWFQRDAEGKLIGEFGHWGPHAYWLDPTHPEAKEFIRNIIRNARKEGFTYFKFDFVEVQSQCRFYDSSKTRLEAFRDLMKLYREEVGEENYMMIACSLIMPGYYGYADATRSGYDSEPEWYAKTWCSISECIHSLGNAAPVNGILINNDPDVTYTRVRGTLTEPELRTWHSLVGLLGGAAMISEPVQLPEYSTPEALWMAEILNPPGPERGRSYFPGADYNHTQFGFESLRPWGNSASILLWNPADEPASRTLDAEYLGVLGEQFHIWSFWDQRYLGVGSDGFSTEQLPPHGGALLRLTAMPAKENLPVLIGSTLHISMGAAEIDDIAVMPDRMVIRLSDAGARAGKLFVFSKGKLSLESSEGCKVDAITEGAEHVWSVSLSERQRGEKEVITLQIK